MQSADTIDSRRGSLLPVLGMACLTGYLSVNAVQFSALRDYFLFTAEYTRQNFGLRLVIQFLLGIYLYLLFAALLYRAVVTRAKPSTAPMSRVARVVDLLSRIVILVSPASAFAFLLIDAAQSAVGGTRMVWLAAAVVCLTAACQIFLIIVDVASSREPDEVCFQDRQKAIWRASYSRDARRPRVVVDPGADRLGRRSWLLLVISAISALMLYTWIWVDIIGATNFVGGIGIILLFLVLLLLGLEMLAWLSRRFRGVVPWLIAVVLLCQLAGGSSPEFAHTTALPENKPDSTADIVPSLAPAFRDWIGSRPNSGNKKYPVFIVAAQGGGQYAAYHTALSLARLYDSCPKLKDHVFAISSVSGGSIGAAMFTELLRQSGTLDDRCSMETAGQGAFEKSIRQLFSNDFVTPVIATGLLFDVPALLIPQLRLLPDRARTLELAYQHAVYRGQAATETQFYSSWSPTGFVPALFFNTTSSNYGTPFLLSQIYMADQRSSSLFVRAFEFAVSGFGGRWSFNDSERVAVLKRLVLDAIHASEYTRPTYFNILEYRSNLQLSLGTASVLSARFPYVTPPGILHSDSRRAEADTTLRETIDLQLIDGGFWDNSGIATANEIIRQLKSANETKELVSNLEFHLISFGHARSALQMAGSRGAQSELFAPIMTFEAVREARRLRPTDGTAGFDYVHGYELFDHKFQAPLSWTLSAKVRGEIEARSGGDVAPSLCCALQAPTILAFMSPTDIVLNLEHIKQFSKSDFLSNPEKEGLKLVAPNLRQFHAITRSVMTASQNAKPVAK